MQEVRWERSWADFYLGGSRIHIGRKKNGGYWSRLKYKTIQLRLSRQHVLTGLNQILSTFSRHACRVLVV